MNAIVLVRTVKAVASTVVSAMLSLAYERYLTLSSLLLLIFNLCQKIARNARLNFCFHISD